MLCPVYLDFLVVLGFLAVLDYLANQLVLGYPAFHYQLLLDYLAGLDFLVPHLYHLILGYLVDPDFPRFHLFQMYHFGPMV